VDPANISSTMSLLEALDGRGGDAAAREAFDRAVWDRLGADGAVLVTDLSGFTRLTKKHGILHFLAIFRRFQRIGLPVINKHGGSLLKQEADDLIGVFDEARDAVEAAIDMLRVAERVNESLDPDDRIGVCVGVDYGRLLRLSDDAFGDPVNVAFKLGEDIAEPGEVLVGAGAMARIGVTGADLEGAVLSAPRSVTIGGAELAHHSLRLAGGAGDDQP
jgi:adenylate cyclase